MPDAQQPSSDNFGANAWLVDDMFEQFRQDPETVSESWREFFAGYKPGGANLARPLLVANGADITVDAPEGLSGSGNGAAATPRDGKAAATAAQLAASGLIAPARPAAAPADAPAGTATAPAHPADTPAGTTAPTGPAAGHAPTARPGEAVGGALPAGLAPAHGGPDLALDGTAVPPSVNHPTR